MTIFSETTEKTIPLKIIDPESGNGIGDPVLGI